MRLAEHGPCSTEKGERERRSEGGWRREKGDLELASPGVGPGSCRVLAGREALSGRVEARDCLLSLAAASLWGKSVLIYTHTLSLSLIH